MEGGREEEVECLQYAKFHLNVFIVSPSGGQKDNFGQTSTFGPFWGPLYTDPFYQRRAKFGAESTPSV